MATDGSSEAASLKEKGNASFKAGDYAAAIRDYTRCVELDPTQHLALSNRSAAYLKLGDSAQEALQDAERCIELAPAWAKGYSRKAAALQELKRWDEALAACEAGLLSCPDDGLRKMAAEVKTRRFSNMLIGAWHGTVNEVLGGYDQEMEFLDESSVRIEVMGKSIVGRHWVDAGPDPHHLNIQVPMQDVPPGMPPPPPVPYIAKISDEGLHLCCPVMKMDRPTEFEGPGYCLMKRGPLAKSSHAETSGLSKEEQCRQCASDLIAALPSMKLEEVSSVDSEAVAREKLMAQVRFESAMFSVQKKFGEDLFKEVFNMAHSSSASPEDVGLAAMKEMRDLRQKLIMVGIIEETPASSPVHRGPSAVPADPTPAKSEPKEVSRDITCQDTDSSVGNPIAGFEIPAAIVGAGVLAALALIMWRRRSR